MSRSLDGVAVRTRSQDMDTVKEGGKGKFLGQSGLFRAGAGQGDYLASADQVIPAWLAEGDIPGRS